MPSLADRLSGWDRPDLYRSAGRCARVSLPEGYTVRPFRREDFSIHPGHLDRLRLASPTAMMLEACLQALEVGPCYTILHDGNPVCSGGVLLTQRGNGTAWQTDNAELLQRTKFFLAIARVFLELAETSWGVWRIEATAEVGNVRQVNWLEHLGFQREGERRSFLTPGDAHLVFVRLSA